jgi:hemerythrin-like domain-containing protein
MAGIIAELHRDHINFLKVLDAIERQANIVATGETPDLDILTGAIEYLREYAGRLHHPLEDAVYDHLKRARPTAAAGIDDMLREHVEVTERLLRFTEAVTNVTRGLEVARAGFARTAYAFVNAERNHISREEAEFLPMALQFLESDDWRAIETVRVERADPGDASETTPALDRLRRMVLEWDTEDQALTANQKASVA